MTTPMFDSSDDAVQTIQVTEVEILEAVPASLKRPLSLVAGDAYAATRVLIRTTKALFR